ncbi:hypothetical protein BGZ61DRAFT_459017 [Ilyonectria robusta]|uniref:uncharacterized protein n=1 Tax=Ilyonectria robusta TaxID=1079257 RepID=UPI001E8E6563|nr:uncharacterized protein BGZ61DRAFT_459017 [Ilyonectria robusta]KAH8672175.1 hypothetical protein BGZ61DRAFT_459017 [Ilyonectria robusta]
MGKTSINFLFTDSRSVKPTREWADLLRSNKDQYADCRVVSFTRVKDLNSDWKHELGYLWPGRDESPRQQGEDRHASPSNLVGLRRPVRG